MNGASLVAVPFLLVWFAIGGLLRAVGLLIAKAPRRAYDELRLLVGRRPDPVAGRRQPMARPRHPGGSAPRHRPAAGPAAHGVRGRRRGLLRLTGRAPARGAGRSGSRDRTRRRGGRERRGRPHPADQPDPDQPRADRRRGDGCRHRRAGPPVDRERHAARRSAADLQRLAPGRCGTRTSMAGTGSGLGTDATPSPYRAVMAGLAWVLQPLSAQPSGLAVSVLLIGALPLSALTAYLAAGTVLRNRWIRAWAALTWATLPTVTGALASGRVGASRGARAASARGAGLRSDPAPARFEHRGVRRRPGPRGRGRLRARAVARRRRPWLSSRWCSAAGPGGPGRCSCIAVPAVLLAPWLSTLWDDPRQLLAGPGLLTTTGRRPSGRPAVAPPGRRQLPLVDRAVAGRRRRRSAAPRRLLAARRLRAARARRTRLWRSGCPGSRSRPAPRPRSAPGCTAR